MCTRPAFLLLCSLSLSSCVGHVTTQSLRPEDVVRPDKELDGIVGYRAVQVVEVSLLTQFSEDGKTFTPNCSRTEIKKIATVPDQMHPVLISYHHGVLEGYSFSAQLNSDGVITAVNTTSSPDQGKTIANLTEAATSLSKLGAAKLAPKPAVVPPCNSSPSFDRYEPIRLP